MRAMRLRRIGNDWELAKVERCEDDDYKYVNIIFQNVRCDEEIGIMFWEDCGNTINFAFCCRYGDPAGVMALDFNDLQLFVSFARSIKTAEAAIEYGKAYGFLKED